jgi:hypothetical protein
MSNAALARPGTVTGSAIVTIGGNKFKIHTQSVEIQIQNKMNEVTGEAHVTPHFQHGGMTYVSFRCTGFVMSGTNDKIGVEDLADPANNKDALITFVMHTGKTIVGKAVFSGVNIAYGRNTPHVQVALSGVFTETVKGVQENPPPPQ